MQNGEAAFPAELRRECWQLELGASAPPRSPRL